MCGYIGTISSKIDEDKLINSLDLIHHRGPDKTNKIFHELSNKKKIFLGHKRLEILDIESGSQPMVSSDNNLIILFNGEIYNHQKLRNILVSEGYKFISSHSDTEVILAGYKIWGTNVAKKLNGMWSFIIYDKKKILFF